MTDHSNDIVLERPRRSRKARNPLVFIFSGLFTFAILGAMLVASYFWYMQNEFTAEGPLAEPTTYTVQKGANFSSIAGELAAQDIIKQQDFLKVFTTGVQRAGRDRDLQTGEFAFTPGMSMRDVMEELVDGTPIQYRLTLPEGLTSYQMVERIKAHPDLTGEVTAVPAEGMMRPDTYLFPRGFERQKLVERVMAAQETVLAATWAGRAEGLPLKTPQDLLTLASIIEKETGVGAEREKVAGVFVNRLKNGMRLQTDPTIIYGIWGGRGKPKDRGGLRRSEIDRETEYNTYQIDGLPPGPIANPGTAALEAAANPGETAALFFVADGTGGHAFADNLEQHNANVAKWRVIERQRGEQAEEELREIDDSGTDG